MNHLNLCITTESPTAPWAEDSLVSFQSEQACIHLPSDGAEKDNVRRVAKATRLLDSMSLPHIQLSGDWSSEYQWAFACAYSGAKKSGNFSFCDDDNRQSLENRHKALLFTRQLINRTPEDISPQVLADEVTEWLSSLAPDSISSRQIVGEELAQHGWTGIYNVGRGSVRPPVLLELDFNPQGSDDAPSVALVGKGITFDSGGYSIKSSEGMLSMKCDMGGAATVAGALGLAIMSGLNKRVKLFLCCAENLISGHAYKLGDILTYKNGLTVEIVNTDAEGRLVLADGLIAASESGAEMVIDAATLTGAAMMAVGGDYNALFTMDAEVRNTFLNYADEEFEGLWPLPLESWHQEKCPSDFADTANSRPQKGGGAGGASNAAGFLSRFVDTKKVKWAHLDLAGAYNGSANSMAPAGATAMGIRTIARALLEQ